MIRLQMKKYSMTLTKKQHNNQHYHKVKLIDMNVLQVKKYCLLIKKEFIIL